MVLVRFAAGLIAAALLLLSNTASAETWQRADTQNFVIYSDGSARTLERFARRAEMFDALFRYYFNLPNEPLGRKLTIYMLEDTEAVSELRGNEDSTTAGFYLARAEGSLAISNRQRATRRTSLDGQTVLFHEYVHHLMAHYFTYGYPAWYREGYAEFFATAEIENDGDWELGKPADHRAMSLRYGDIPLETVLFGDLNTLGPRARSAYYGKAWLMVHMFNFNEERSRQRVDYLTRVGSGGNPREAFAQTFGDIETLESELDSYMRGRLFSRVSDNPVTIRGEITVTRIDGPSAELVRLSMSRRVGRDQQNVRDALLDLAARNPENGEILAELALAENDLAQAQDSSDFQGALQATHAALAINPGDSAMLLLKAQLMMENVDEETDWNEIRSLIMQARSTEPNNPVNYTTMHETYLKEGTLAPVPVINDLGTALMLAPEATNIRVRYSVALANEGMFQDSLRLIDFLASDPHSGGIGTELIDHIRGMRERAIGSAASQ